MIQMNFDFRDSWNRHCYYYCSNGDCCFHGYRPSITDFGSGLDDRCLLGNHRGPCSIRLQNCGFLARSVRLTR